MEVGALGFTKKRGMSGSTSDMLSNLPSNVQEKILACMTIQDAVRTSVLSRKWRYIWTTLPELVLNDKFCKGMMRATTKELLMTIYKVLLLHRGPILKFTLTLAKLENCAEINQLIYFLSTKGIRILTFHIRKDEPYKMPSTLFSCLQLEQLNLHSCVFRPPPGFEGFTKLLSLELYEVDLAGDVFTSLISSCPLLERLTIYYCTCIDYLELPNLKYIQCEGLFQSICSRNVSPDADISIELKGSRNQLGFNEGEISNSAMLLGIVPVVEFLVLDYAYVKFLAVSGVRERLPTTLTSLEDIMLHDICFGEPDEVSIVLYFIKRSPNLRGLHIRVFQGDTAATNPVVELGDVRGFFYSLRVVYLEEVSGTKTEMDFIELLLAKSPMLHTMLIKLKSKEVAEELRIVKELTGFKRVSRNAVITF